MNKPKLILFDIGGVLIEYGNVFKTASQELDIPHNLIDSTFDKYDTDITTGKITPQELYLNCINENGLPADKNYDFMLSWINDYESIKPTHELLVDLANNYRIGLFSNIYKGMIPELIKQNFLPNVEYAYKFASCDMGLQKPDPKAYEFVLKETKLAPEDILFVDDKEENLIVANNMGWKTYKFDRNSPKVSIDGLRLLLI